MTSMEDLNSISLRGFCELRNLCRRGNLCDAFDARAGMYATILGLMPSWIASWLAEVFKA